MKIAAVDGPGTVVKRASARAGEQLGVLSAVAGAALKTELEGRRVCAIVHHSNDFDPRVWKTARALQSQGALVDVVLLAEPGRLYQHDLSMPFRIERLHSPNPASRHPLRFVVGNMQFQRHLKHRRYDVIHANDGSTLLVAASVARRCGAVLVYDAHEYFPGYMPKAATAPGKISNALHVNTLVERAFIRRADAVIAVSDGISDALTNHYRLEVAPTVIRNVPTFVPREHLDVGYLRRAVDVPDAAPVVAWVGAVTARRGAENAVDVISQTADAVLALIGPVHGRYRERLEAIARERGVADRVRIAGPVPYDDVVHAVSGSDAVLYMPSIGAMSESIRMSLPNKLFEAVMARVPVVMPALPEIERVVYGHGIGHCVDRGDPTAAAAALDELLRGHARRAMAERLDAAAEVLCWDAEQERLFGLYSRALRSH